MVKRLHIPTTTNSHGIAFGLPINEAIQRMYNTAEAMVAAAEKAPAKSDSFGQRIAEAVKARSRQPRIAVFAESADEQSFGEKVSQAIKQH